MKLKGLKARAYHIIFHTHTVSGIVLSIALFVIFYAGAFTLFKAEIGQWENPKIRNLEVQGLHFQELFKALESQQKSIDWDEDLRIVPPSKENPMVSVYGHLKTEDGHEEHFDQQLKPIDYSPMHHSSTLGETLYRLHFLDQIPTVGRYLAGFVSLFFLFASLTGLLIHWRNIFTKLWSFSLKGAKKQIWANAHTVLGFLGLPFQLMYAVSGAFYLLLPLILLPSVAVLYEGNVNKVYEIVYPSLGVQYEEDSPPAQNLVKLEELYTKVLAENPDLALSHMTVKHLKREDASVEFSVESRAAESFDNYGAIGYRIASGEELYALVPQKDKPYTNKVLNGIGQLHFATFGGLLLKVVYFILAQLTCFMIISGVLLWREARKNKNYTEKQKRFHARTTCVYLAICLGLMPAVPVLFGSELLVPQGSKHAFWVNAAFFSSWMAFVLLGLYLKKDRPIMHYFMLLTGIFSLAVPVINGILTGDWLWRSLELHHYEVAGIDMFWLLSGLLFMSLVFSKTHKNPATKF